MSSSRKRKPIVVVSLDSKCSGRVLTQVLLVCKQFAFEAQATRIIVDLSVSRAALQVDVRLLDLGLTLEALSNANTSVSYHPFIIDPFEKTVTYNGKKAQDFLRKWAEEQD